jgi:hypothetical protein
LVSHWKLIRAPDRTVLQEPRTGTFSVFKNFTTKTPLHEPVVGSCVYRPVGATTGAAEILIPPLHSQSRLATSKRDNRKIRHEIEILNANEHAP